MAPRIVPIKAENTVAIRPTASDTRPPTRTRERMSRPFRSVPHQCSGLGGLLACPRFCFSASASLPTNASTIRMMITTTPTTAIRCFAKRRSVRTRGRSTGRPTKVAVPGTTCGWVCVVVAI
jgi:hypothetical protein